jgi:alpha-galactosidase
MRSITFIFAIGFALFPMDFLSSAWADDTLADPANPKGPAEVLTPPTPRSPLIHGPKVFGLHPGSPFVYAIPATGDRPMTFSADNLPASLHLDPSTGQITGSIAKPGDYQLTFHVGNSLGKADRPFRLVVGDQIGLTPAMGWNSWNCWGENVDQEKVLNAAQAMASSGLAQHGWTYVNIDDTWQGTRGGDFNAIQPNLHRFPDIKGLVDSIHQLGLKAGIYSTPWVTSYAGRNGGSADNPEGTWEHPKTRGPYRRNIMPFAIGPYPFATQDAKQWALWGIDYLKYDWGPVQLPESREMASALRASGRDILFSISNNTSGNIFDEIAELSQVANSWRTTTDISDSWKSVVNNGFSADKWAPFAGPGHFNDPDMLVLGQVGKALHPNHLTPDEQYSHMSLWCLSAAPLLLSCNLEKVDPFTLGLLTNDEVIDVDQDALGKQATQVAKDGDVLIYAKPLENGSWAVGFFNRSKVVAKATLEWSAIGLSGSQAARDLWRQKDLGQFDDHYSAEVNPHGVVLISVSVPQDAKATVSR